MMIETITLRTTPYTVEKAASGIRMWLTEDVQSESGQSIEMFHRCPSTGDFLVMLRRMNQTSPELSRLGLMIVRFLEQYGSVQHTLWISDNDHSMKLDGNVTTGITRPGEAHE
ncbi:hypothetical protein JW823_05065 [bacterium]|nr:hypothetical protein [candidate division CSSED10-310 bacterium]